MMYLQAVTSWAGMRATANEDDANVGTDVEDVDADNRSPDNKSVEVEELVTSRNVEVVLTLLGTAVVATKLLDIFQVGGDEVTIVVDSEQETVVKAVISSVAVLASWITTRFARAGIFWKTVA
jgi:hypothetical protein